MKTIEIKGKMYVPVTGITPENEINDKIIELNGKRYKQIDD